MPFTLDERVRSYARTFPEWESGWPTIVHNADGDKVMQGIWVFGQDFRNKSKYYGAFPGNFLDRLAALLADASIKPGALPYGGRVLHVFSGSLGVGPYDRCDLQRPDVEYPCSVYDLPVRLTGDRYDVIIADPPYSPSDAKRYGTTMIDRKRTLATLRDVAAPGAILAWLDTCWPQHRKEQWRTVGRIYIQRSTNHRVRLLSLFECVA